MNDHVNGTMAGILNSVMPKANALPSVPSNALLDHLPCPFCGRTPELMDCAYTDADGCRVAWWSVCCGVTRNGCGAAQSARTPEWAWRLWDRRSNASAQTLSEAK